jgi:hypothetical protein
MTLLRRHLRLWVAVWIAFQAASLSAFVPRECCFAHRMPAQEQSADESCHHPQPARKEMPECALRSACNGPLAVLAALLSPHAVLADRTGIVNVAVTVAPVRVALVQPRSLVIPPDSPPPRG